MSSDKKSMKKVIEPKREVLDKLGELPDSVQEWFLSGKTFVEIGDNFTRVVNDFKVFLESNKNLTTVLDLYALTELYRAFQKSLTVYNTMSEDSIKNAIIDHELKKNILICKKLMIVVSSAKSSLLPKATPNVHAKAPRETHHEAPSNARDLNNNMIQLEMSLEIFHKKIKTRLYTKETREMIIADCNAFQTLLLKHVDSESSGK